MKRSIIALSCLLVGLAVATPAAADRYRDYDGYDGYKNRPYDRSRHYQHHEHRGHRYSYRGHWRSWDEWDRYTRKHPKVREHGRYYREGAHLMFRSCPPDAETCFFFSIGR